jgi:hypothetical protein
MEHMLLRLSPGFRHFLPLALLAVFSINCVAQTPPESAHERTVVVERYAVERLSVWQRRLNLQDWNISVVVSRATDLKPKTLGNIHWDTDKKTAVLRVLDPADYKLAFNDMLQDVEFTVVHELIHLELSPVLSPLQRNDANRREEEHAVNHMADALLRLDRLNKAAPPVLTTGN